MNIASMSGAIVNRETETNTPYAGIEAGVIYMIYDESLLLRNSGYRNYCELN